MGEFSPPFFWAPFFLFFSYPSNIEIIFDFSDFSDWGGENSPPHFKILDPRLGSTFLYAQGLADAHADCSKHREHGGLQQSAPTSSAGLKLRVNDGVNTSTKVVLTKPGSDRTESWIGSRTRSEKKNKVFRKKIKTNQIVYEIVINKK